MEPLGAQAVRTHTSPPPHDDPQTDQHAHQKIAPFGGSSSTVTEGVVDIPLARLRFGYSPRYEEFDRTHVDVLVGLLPRLPPILVHAPSMRVIDGVHRVIAARSAQLRTLPARLFYGTESEATVQAVVRNVAHGKPLTLAERQRSARRILRACPDWSDRRIALACGLSPKTVGRLRSEIPEVGGQVRRGRDGKVRPVDPAEVRQRIAEAITNEPDASIRAIAAATGSSPGTVRDVRSRMSRGESVVGARASRPAPATTDEPAEEKVNADPAFQSSAAGAAFAAWFGSRVVSREDEWEGFVGTVPLSRVYEVADAARKTADMWCRFAAALELRASGKAGRSALPVDEH